MDPLMEISEEKINQSLKLLKSASRVTAFTGAGISVESGIPPFRGQDGLWTRYDPRILELDFFHLHPELSWPVLKKIFYDFIGAADPNPAHLALAEMENRGFLHAVITQNIDGLHQKAGNTKVYEFHGSISRFVCTGCGSHIFAESMELSDSPPRCKECGSLLKPDFIFFGEAIPEGALSGSLEETRLSDLFLIIGTTGEVAPACLIPRLAKENGARIIEINPEPSKFTNQITDLFLPGKASRILTALTAKLFV